LLLVRVNSVKWTLDSLWIGQGPRDCLAPMEKRKIPIPLEFCPRFYTRPGRILVTVLNEISFQRVLYLSKSTSAPMAEHHTVQTRESGAISPHVKLYRRWKPFYSLTLRPFFPCCDSDKELGGPRSSSDILRGGNSPILPTIERWLSNISAPCLVTLLSEPPRLTEFSVRREKCWCSLPKFLCSYSQQGSKGGLWILKLKFSRFFKLFIN
jgi:hypothetical protein